LDFGLAFEWDDANRDHITHHQVSPEEAEQVIDNDPLDIEAETVDGEQRFISVRHTDRGRFLLVVTTPRHTRIRVVTAFPAPKNLIDLYLTRKGASHG
jgi:uncharacterized DUF497 family protein